jgi:hypothetical protein
MARSTQKFKKLIFDTLNNDITLRGLLGGIGRIKYGSPENLSNYPCATYQILAEEDEPYRPDVETFITRARVITIAFVKDPSPLIAGNIDDRIQALLHGAHLSDANVKVFSCSRVNKSERFEPQVNVWTIQSSYDIVTITK